MVIVKFSGGLGNQMFQYALGRSLSITSKKPIYFDISGFINEKKRQFELLNFNIAGEFLPEDLKRNLPGRINPVLGYLKDKIGLYEYRIKYIQEKKYDFDENILSLSAPVILDGYWQSEKYFKSQSQIIRNDFTLATRITYDRDKTLQLLSNCNSVSVHIRRGDYITDKKTNNFHGTCDLSYYVTAMNIMAEKISNPDFFIFSDDISWARQNLPNYLSLHFVERSKDGRDFEDLFLMSRCQNQIMANSSFSWWAAWLNIHTNKIVIAPKKWFHNAPHNTKDLYLEGWLKV